MPTRAWGEAGAHLRSGGGTRGVAPRRGPRRGPRRPSDRVIRQPRRCRRCRRAPTSTMRLVLSHTQGVSRPHILLLDAARRGAARRAGPRNEREREIERERERE